MRAIDARGALLELLDAKARRKKFKGWVDFVTTLELQHEDLMEVRAVLQDMEDGDLDSIGKGGAQ